MPIAMIVFDRDGVPHNLVAEKDQSLMQVIQSAKLEEYFGICGGCCCCGTCRVYVDASSQTRLTEPSINEQFILRSIAEKGDGSRLSCQLTCSSEMEGAQFLIANEF